MGFREFYDILFYSIILCDIILLERSGEARLNGALQLTSRQLMAFASVGSPGSY